MTIVLNIQLYLQTLKSKYGRIFLQKSHEIILNRNNILCDTYLTIIQCYICKLFLNFLLIKQSQERNKETISRIFILNF